MPFRYRSRRPYRPRRRFVRRRTRVTRPVRSGILSAYKKGHIHSFARYTSTLTDVNHNNWAVTPTADTVDSSMFVFTTPAAAGISYAAIGFRLADLQSYNEFNTLFDYFRINAVKLTFSWMYDNNTFGGGSLAPMMYVAVDHDDNAVPASVGELIQYPNCRQIQLFNKAKGVVSVYCKPRHMNSTTLQQSTRRNRPWTDMAGAATVGFDGVKFAVVNRNAASVAIYVRAKYYVQCKGQR